ncbi:type I glyceraldehyde-3-phosphate dehydrogenase [candidate division WWE3 bacterium CG09_land_8_20_14_0_10_39_24]|uniref:Type I glyceraldehyde-3-phosphate dehydrogenase n=2 Tax=Katanobacteria TaxID=422282 RepID=A0A2G9XBL8_UNCKA|nr:MAG: type I glyceraldehyde-3-phosphate dehydrogenase [bacterium CG09_39_24]PIP04327.1 MAG: type I glyceraldehyde-3-phosphate dehydrogenase [candidate division WWE3 bacterium CG23_combo_of_CG06-09_8_20_14_all_40_14]PIS12832.1 MAG: type I glyceraldehyde-3-phosphate dehydrogenase [candidate division WWE3 bacterium CG09_land_8_20_14_0_10_39_24]
MPKIKIAINGFGRIGRAAFKAATNNLNSGLTPSLNLNCEDVEICAINDLTDTKTLAYLLKYDSVYGKLNKDIKTDEKNIFVGGEKYPIFAEKDPGKLPWKDLGVDIVLECTGRFTEYDKAKMHITSGAKKVIISAPGKGFGGDIQVLGTEKAQKGNFADILSNGSCTTNCISPVMQVLETSFGIEKSFMTTVHSYTSTQNIVDGPSKDLRRGRAGASNIIPTTTGAAIAATKVIATLNNKFDGIALRVPTLCGSISDITAIVKRTVTAEEVNKRFEKAENEPLFKGILKTTKDPLVSSDILGTPFSSIVDTSFTKVVGGNMVKVFCWYDNEWAYSLRLVELAIKSFN